MSQPVTVHRYHLVDDEHSRIMTDGHPEDRKEDVEELARETGRLVAVTSSSGYGWDETARYDPAADAEGSA